VTIAGQSHTTSVLGPKAAAAPSATIVLLSSALFDERVADLMGGRLGMINCAPKA
jgi:hypothetical protein